MLTILKSVNVINHVLREPFPGIFRCPWHVSFSGNFFPITISPRFGPKGMFPFPKTVKNMEKENHRLAGPKIRQTNSECVCILLGVPMCFLGCYSQMVNLGFPIYCNMSWRIFRTFNISTTCRPSDPLFVTEVL